MSIARRGLKVKLSLYIYSLNVCLCCLQLTFPVRVLASLGADVLMATNACGSLNREYNVGDLVIVRDHINLPGLVGMNPLMGLSDDR